MPLIESFKATTRLNAFILASLVTATAVVVGVEIKTRMTTFVDKDGYKIKHHPSWRGVLITFAATFAASMLAYGVLYYLVGIGEGMMVCE